MSEIHLIRDPLPHVSRELTNVRCPESLHEPASPLVKRLAMHQATTYHWSFFEDVGAYQEAGFEALGVWRPKLYDFGEERAIDLLLESKLDISSVSWTGGFTGTDSGTYREAIYDAKDALSIAERVRAKSLLVVTGNNGSYTKNHARKLIVDVLRLLGDRAAEHGLNICLQPIHPDAPENTSLLSNLSRTLELIDDCQHPHVGMVLDLFQLRHEKTLIERIPEIFPFIKNVQIADWQHVTDGEPHECAVGDGVARVRECVAKLERQGYQGYYDLQLRGLGREPSNYWNVLKQSQEYVLAGATIRGAMDVSDLR